MFCWQERSEELHQLSKPLTMTCYGTSIWDETLYKVITRSEEECLRSPSLFLSFLSSPFLVSLFLL